jgi:hypothetical protein
LYDELEFSAKAKEAREAREGRKRKKRRGEVKREKIGSVSE